MTRLFIIVSMCSALMLGSCLENSSQSNKTNGGGTTTTTTDDGGSKNNNKDQKNSFHSNNGKFSINFLAIPDGPTRTEEKNLAGMVEVFTYTQDVSANSKYVVLYKDYPVGVITDSNTEDKLKLEARAFVKGFGGATFGNTVDERLNGNKGISFTGTLNDTIKLSMRSFFVGKRYYQFGTISTNGEISDKDTKKFISSFELD